jgi:hypothetical protein
MMSDPAPDAIERKLASQLLEVHQRGYSVALYFRWQAAFYIALSFCFGIGIACFYWLKLQSSAITMIAVLMGMVFRDYQLARAQLGQWKIHERLFDWEKVGRMAAGESMEA